MENEMVNTFFSLKTSDCERDNFFLKTYTIMDASSKAKFLSLMKNNILFNNPFVNWTYYLNCSDHQDEILNIFIKDLDLFINEDNIEKSVELLPLVEFYTGLGNDLTDVTAMLRPFEKLQYLANNTHLFNNNLFHEILMNMTKKIAYTYSYPDIYDALEDNKNYKYFISLLISYIDFKNEMLDDELINLIVEINQALNSKELAEKMYNKYPDVSLDKYSMYIKDMVRINNDPEPKQFFSDIKKYRIKYGIIPEDICLYINKCYASYDSLISVCNIDLIRHHLKKQGIENVCVFNDNNLPRRCGGEANERMLSVRRIRLDMTMYHEARHIVQFDNMANDKNYYRYNYNILKDTILSNYLDHSVYDRNHNRFLFEIDADIQGLKDYYETLGKIGRLTYIDKEKMSKIEENEQFRIDLSYNLNVDGYNYFKGDLFDDILKENSDLLDMYPVLKIEYNSDGSRKSIIEILDSLEKESHNNKRTEDELYDIGVCIFGDYFVINDEKENLELLNNYKTDNEIVNYMKNYLFYKYTNALKNKEKGV